MKWSLARKFIFTAILFIICSFLLTCYLSSVCVRRYLLESRLRAMNAMSSNLSQLISTSMERGNSDLLIHQDMLDLFTASDCYIVWIINTNGVISFSNDHLVGTQIAFDPMIDGSYFHGIYNPYLSQDAIGVYSPIIPVNSFQPVGYVLIHHPYIEIISSRNQILTYIYLIWFACVLLWIGCTAILYLIVSRPVRQMMKRVNEDQRQFIANVSHDLRSPLTSIKGYLEAIQDGTIPPELEGKYINIVLNETNRLTELTRNLLTITSLDSGQDSLQRTSFDINSVIRQVLLTFEQRCQKQGIHFSLTFSGQSQMVFADLIKIQQVLYNLIDNAIKFSPRDSVIEITTTAQYGKLFVSVRDHGIGIPAESIPKIWNRFYKTDSSRGHDKKGIGLGLSIVRNIITLHGESIQVKSHINQGSEFIFSLPLA